MYLTRLHPHLLAAGVLIGLVSAEQHARRGVECYFDTQAASGDTCESLASAWGLSTDDFVKLNPGVICPNLEAGKTYCVVGDSTPDQSTSSSLPPKISSTTSTTSAVLTTTTVSSTTIKTTPSTSTMPLATSKTTSVTTILPSTTSQTTSTTTSKPITTTQSTTMKTSTAAAPSNSPTMPGAASNCNKWYKITSGDTCDVVATKNGITVTQLRSWNTQINTSCSNLWADYYVCTGVPGAAPTTTTTTTAPPAPSNSPALPGAVSNCNKWYKIASGDTCDVLAGKNAITVAQLYRWNTQINSSCNNLLLGYYACVGIPGAAAPMPGIVSNCKRYYQVVSGDSCDSIAQKNGITVANFRRWNTAINTGCTNLWADALVCTSA
ncbi:hypothetical protein CkaCkLH20_08997 [Colletotrichum karsti]|uniref:LysM domain-containing protein n=1 Tax=Colletotrichum karsti TaxID=1095194 RepID=A0A9P6LHG0_9PEZI|nr:uncharacterized protein CkaCkLH20_08997 [Colletotrichum karsti]KAF9873538.1 hypothetical protein CkaCkLH20_08997 [Colletotrichum karsti]